MKLTFRSMLGAALTAAMLTISACGAGAPNAADAPAQTQAQVQKIAPAAYQTQFGDSAQDHLLVDVRTPEEFASGAIPGAVNIPLQELEQHLDEIPTGSPVVVYCRSGNRSAQASAILRKAGYSRIYDLGGIRAWQAAGLPVQ